MNRILMPEQIDFKERFRSAFYGVVIGDMMGVPFQFESRENVKHLNTLNYISEAKKFSEKNGIPFGTFSDDTAMTLATMDCMAEIKGVPQTDADYKILVSKFLNWYVAGEYTQDGEAWDIGNATASAMNDYVKAMLGEKDFNFNQNRDEDKAGNGSLMRFLPIAFMVETDTKYRKISNLRRLSAVTHSSSQCETICMLYVMLIQRLLEGAHKEHLMRGTLYMWSHNRHLVKGWLDRVFKSDFVNEPIETIRSSGYVVDTFEAAIWCFLTTNTFDECLVKALSLGNDTDTIASIACGIAGAYYNTYNHELLDCVRNKEMLEPILARYLELFDGVGEKE